MTHSCFLTLGSAFSSSISSQVAHQDTPSVKKVTSDETAMKQHWVAEKKTKNMEFQQRIPNRHSTLFRNPNHQEVVLLLPASPSAPQLWRAKLSRAGHLTNHSASESWSPTTYLLSDRARPSESRGETSGGTLQGHLGGVSGLWRCEV